MSMRDTSNKRKAPAAGRDGGGGGASKRSKGGSGGKWQTPHQQSRSGQATRGGKIEPGDVGIWATCQKNKEGKATEELKDLFSDYAETFYGLVPTSEPPRQRKDAGGDDEEEEVDIEASIQQELSSLNSKPAPGQAAPTKHIQPVYIDVPCVLFFKTAAPIDPVYFVQKICEDVQQNPGKRRCRFVNRLTPMMGMAKATEKGLEELGRRILRRHFKLTGEERAEEVTESWSYAIRPTFRNHNTLKRMPVIDLIANLIDKSHKVDLTKPDKTIVVEIYQTICGISVMDSAWDTELKHFNIFELYQPTVANDNTSATSDADHRVTIKPLPQLDTAL